jgi:hypothetical protein
MYLVYDKEDKALKFNLIKIETRKWTKLNYIVKLLSKIIWIEW